MSSQLEEPASDGRIARVGVSSLEVWVNPQSLEQAIRAGEVET